MCNQIEWRRALIRSGFLFREVDGVFDFAQENPCAEEFLQLVLREVEQIKDYRGRIFSPSSSTVDETAWLAAIEKLHGSSEGGSANMHDFEMPIMDTYMAGIVRWMNAAGIRTSHSCDGHTRREPYIELIDPNQEPLLDFFVRAVSNGVHRSRRIKCSHRASNPIRPTDGTAGYDRYWLLDVAEKVHQHQELLRQFVMIAKKLSHQAQQDAATK